MSTLADIQIDEKIKQATQEPAKYKVIFINDETTPIEWVIEILVKLFKHSQTSAEALTLQIHNEGSAVVGIYSYEIAEQKSVEATLASRDKGFPLQIRLEKE
jgi:ATP-dependent Clp protease adaptor protein ClpS